MSIDGEALRQLVPPNEDRTLLILVRHGVTAWNIERRFQGQLDVPLSEEGLSQARSVAIGLASLSIPVTAIYSSDLRRAAATAAEIGRQLGVTPLMVAELRELHAGAWSGLTVGQVEEQYPGELKRWRENIKSYTLPEGESIPDVQRRIFGYLSGVLRNHKGESVIAVSHGAALSAYLAALYGWDLQETWDTRRARMSNTGVTAVLVASDGGETETLFFNSTAHLVDHTPLLSVIDPEPGKGVQEPSGELAV